jgi:prophage regulatory protein
MIKDTHHCSTALHVHQSAIPPIIPILRRPTVQQFTGKSKSAFYRDLKAGLFTKPVTIAEDKHGYPCSVGWPYNEVQAINQARIAGKSNAEIKKLVQELEASRCEDNKKLADSFNSPQEENG